MLDFDDDVTLRSKLDVEYATLKFAAVLTYQYRTLRSSLTSRESSSWS